MFDCDDEPSFDDMYWLLEPLEDEEDEDPPQYTVPQMTAWSWIFAILFWVVVCLVGGFFVILGGV